MKHYTITNEIDDLLRDKIACEARGIEKKCNELAAVAIYRTDTLHSIEWSIDHLMKNHKLLLEKIGEPVETIFNGDVNK